MFCINNRKCKIWLITIKVALPSNKHAMSYTQHIFTDVQCSKFINVIGTNIMFTVNLGTMLCKYNPKLKINFKCNLL